MRGRDKWVVGLLCLLYGTAAALSWVKSDLTTNDFERFDDLRLTVAYFLIFLALSAIYLDRVAHREATPRALVWGGWLVFLLPLVAMFPVASKDVFMYSFHAKIWAAYGGNPYLDPSSSFVGDDWLRFLNVWWVDNPFPYGPLALEQARAIYAFAGTSLAGMIVAFRLCDVLLLAACARLIADLAALARPSTSDEAGKRALLLWLWCPLAIFEAASSAHNDLTMVFLMLAAISLHLRGRWLLSLALLLLAFWFKWYSVVLLPVWFAYQWRRRPASFSLSNASRAAVVCALLSGLILAPFWGSFTALSERVFANENLFRIFPSEMPPPLWLIFQAGSLGGLFDEDGGSAVFNVARFSLFAACLAWIVWRRGRGPYATRAYLEDCFWSFLSFFGFAVAILWPWHLLSAVAFALASGERRLEWAAAILTTLALLSYFLTFTVATLMCGTVAAALWVLRRGGRAAAPQSF